MRMSNERLRSFAFHFPLILIAALVPIFLFGWGHASTSPDPGAGASRLAKQLDTLMQIRLRETFTICRLPINSRISVFRTKLACSTRRGGSERIAGLGRRRFVGARSIRDG